MCTTAKPYVKRLSEKIRRVGNKYKIRTTIRTTNTNSSTLTKTKPENMNQRMKECIHQNIHQRNEQTHGSQNQRTPKSGSTREKRKIFVGATCMGRRPQD